jgi:hypothetical protein
MAVNSRTLAHLFFLFSLPIFLRISIGLAWELHGEILWEGRMSGRKQDLVWTFHCIYRWFGVVPQGLIVFLPFSVLMISGAFSWIFRGEDLRAFLWGILVGCHVWGPCASLLGDLDPTNPLKRLRFRCFRWFRSMGRCSWGLSFDSSWLSGFWGLSF